MFWGGFGDFFRRCSGRSLDHFPGLPEGFWGLLEKMGLGGGGGLGRGGGAGGLPNEDSYRNSRSTARQAAASKIWPAAIVLILLLLEVAS